jgi:cobalt-zinc-cadmium efflux system membrane fusion protein
MRKNNLYWIGTVVFITVVLSLVILHTEKGASVRRNEGHGHSEADKDHQIKHHERRGAQTERHDRHIAEQRHGHDDVETGPHGGRLLADGDFQAEVTIFETGVPPHFRIYLYEQDKPLNPALAEVSVELHRLGGKVSHFGFKALDGYLYSEQTVEEPHSFQVKVFAEKDGKKHQWEYAQVEGRVSISSGTAALSGIAIETAGPASLKSVVELPGEIALNSDRVAHIVPRVAGVVSECRKNLGDQVEKGEVIAVIESRELAEAKANFLVAMERLSLAQFEFDRAERLRSKDVTPEKEYLATLRAFNEAKIQLFAARKKLLALGLNDSDLELTAKLPSGPLTTFELRAPFNGTIISKHLSVGEWVEANADVFSVADLSTVWVEIIVYVKDVQSVRIGQKATVKSDSGGLVTTGAVSYVGPLVGEESRTARARVVIPNPDGNWRPGLFVSVELISEEGTVPVAVRSEAIHAFRDWSVVFVRYGDEFEARPLELGRTDGKLVEVVKGLEPGEKYAVANSFLLKSELGKMGLSHQH